MDKERGPNEPASMTQSDDNKDGIGPELTHSSKEVNKEEDENHGLTESPAEGPAAPGPGERACTSNL